MFVVFALPRSRTNWIGFPHIRRVAMRPRPDQALPLAGRHRVVDGPADAPALWRLARRRSGACWDASVMSGWPTVRRPVADVVVSLQAIAPEAFDTDAVTATMTRLDRKLDQIERRLPDVLSVAYDDLATEAGCRRLWEHCLPYPFDARWHARLADVNVQENLGLTVRHYVAYKPQLMKLAQLAAHRIISDMRPADASSTA